MKETRQRIINIAKDTVESNELESSISLKKSVEATIMSKEASLGG